MRTRLSEELLDSFSSLSIFTAVLYFKLFSLLLCVDATLPQFHPLLQPCIFCILPNVTLTRISTCTSLSIYTIGQPLTDGDRWPWLDKIALDLKRWGDAGESAVVACSALKRAYRERLRDGASFGGAEVRFVHLRLDIPTLRERMLKRADHFMPDSLIESQFEALEPPGDEEACLDVDAVDGAPDVIAGRVAARLQTQ